MSKNFELLQQAGVGLATVPSVTDDAATRETKSQEFTGALETTSSIAPTVRDETLKIVQTLFLGQGAMAPRSVVFASVDSKSGCGTLCSVVARLLAESVSGSVCLLEANLRTPALAGSLGVPSYSGLADSLRQDSSISGFARRVERENLWLIPAGSQSAEATSLLSRERMQGRIAELRKEFHYVLITAPSLSTYADGIVLGGLADGLVLVLEANQTRRESALRIVESLRAQKILLLGAVLNNRTFPIPSALYERI